ncbi:MAG: histidine--tRNA ligase [Methanomicrobiales archaeon]|nr:histidine--tRNA ligase [Methanomicrobiales archaeon]
MLQKPRGTRDFLPEEMERRRMIESTMRDQARRWGYREVCTPIFEELEIFTMRSGEGIIQEMYIFEDKGGRKLALRPEVTASVLRMYVNEARVIPKPLRWYYFSDCFRYERPQKGRYRQFWQFGVELIGADSALADAEVISVADAVLRAAGVGYELKVGHLAPMKQLLSSLDPRLQRSTMGFLDKRDFSGLESHLCSIHEEHLLDQLLGLATCSSLEDLFAITGSIPERTRIERLFQLLDLAGIDYSFNFGIARGLDYYTGMVFEGFADNLGAENQIIGGGAYRLAHLFGGDDVASCGFAIGFDRVVVSIGEVATARPIVIGIACTEDSRRYATEVAGLFRKEGICVLTDLSDRGLSTQLAHLSRDADIAIILGKRETEAGTVTLKNLHTGEQRELVVAEAIAEVKGSGNR